MLVNVKLQDSMNDNITEITVVYVCDQISFNSNTKTLLLYGGYNLYKETEVDKRTLYLPLTYFNLNYVIEAVGGENTIDFTVEN